MDNAIAYNARDQWEREHNALRGDFHSPAFDVTALQAAKNKHGARLSLKGICMSIQKEQINEKIDKYYDQKCFVTKKSLERSNRCILFM